jgi:O-antigen/teichoic acid export membrane protein
MMPLVAVTGLRRLIDRARPDGSRSRRRYWRAGVTFLAWIATKAVALLALYVSVPLAVGYLGAERYGVWMTAISAAGLLGFATLGLEKGLLNALAVADGCDNRAAARRLVSTTFFMMGGVFALLLVLFGAIYPLLPWARLLGVAPGAAAEAGPVMAALTVATLLSLLGGLVETVQAAYQEGFLNGLWDALGKLLALAALALAIAVRASLPWLALIVAAAPLLAVLANGTVLFRRRRPWLTPRLALVRRAAARQLVGAGSLFFLGQIALTVAYYADPLIVAQLAGSEAVAAYTVTSRIFDIPGMLLLLAGNALWPPLAEAIARGDIAWAERGLRRLLLAAFALVTAIALPLILFGPALLHWWVGGRLAAPPSLFLAFGLFWMLSALSQPVAVFLNAAHALRFQLACGAALAAGGLALKLLLARDFGIVGVAWGRVVAELLFLLVPYGVFLPRLLARLRRAKAIDGAVSRV